MKKTLIIASLLSASSAFAATDVLVGGFSFDDLITNSFDAGGDFTNDASYSVDAPGSLVSGEFWADGSFGSTDLANAGGFFTPGDAIGVDGNLTSGLDILGSLTDFPATGSRLRIGANGSFTIELNATGFQDFEVFYSGLESGASTIQWSYSTTGGVGTFSNVGSAVELGVSDAQLSFDLSAVDAIENSTFYLKGDVATAGFIDIDNIAIYGAAATTAVPEPSTYAMIMAGVVGVMAYFRRRRQAA